MKPICNQLFVYLVVTLIFIGSAYSQTVNDATLLDYYQGQRYLEAVNYLKSIYQEPINNPVALRNLAYASQMASKLADAEGYYQRLYDLDSTKLNVLTSLAGINLRRGNLDKAGRYYKKLIATDSTNFIVLKQLADIGYRKNDTSSYVKYLSKANFINPEDPDVASDLSNWYVNSKRNPLAEQVLKKAITADPENVVLMQSLIKLQHAQENWAETIKTGTQLLQKGDGSYQTMIKLAQAYYRLKNYTCCLETLAGMDQMQQNETSYYYMALSYKALKRYNKAIENFDLAINDGISPAIPSYYGEMAGSYQETKRFKKAVQLYERGLTFDERPMLLYSLATLYDTDLKDKAKAVKYYKKYLSTNPPALQRVYVDYTKSRITALGSRL
jgi:tetratricopeptide (TPR) repeat protein